MSSVPLLVIRNNGILKASSLRTPATVIAKSNSILSLAYRLTRNDVPKGNTPNHQQNQLHHGLKASGKYVYQERQRVHFFVFLIKRTKNPVFHGLHADRASKSAVQYPQNRKLYALNIEIPVCKANATDSRPVRESNEIPGSCFETCPKRSQGAEPLVLSSLGSKNSTSKLHMLIHQGMAIVK
jgi:hypothetical protein